MKKTTRFLALLLLFLSLIQGALAYEDAASKITIFTQNNYTSSEWALRGTKNPTTLKGAGCHLFAYAHAYQWLAGVKANNSLLKDLIAVCRNPSDGPDSGKAAEDINHTYCGSIQGKKHTNSTAAYNAWMQYKLGSNLTISNSSDTKKIVNNEVALKSLYDNGGVIISNPGGHYVVSVGYRVYNNTLYIEIVDSSRWTTIRTDGKTAFDYNNIIKSATYSPNKGDRFWVKWSTYKTFRHDNAFSLKKAEGSYTILDSNLKSFYLLKSKRTSYSTPYDGTVSGQSFSKVIKTFNNGT